MITGWYYLHVNGELGYRPAKMWGPTFKSLLGDGRA